MPKFWRCGLAVVVYCLLTTAATIADEVSVKPSDLNDEVVRRIDRTAAQAPPESHLEKRAGIHGDLISWLISRAPLTAAEEVERAQALYAEMTAGRKIIPTAKEADELLQFLAGALPESLAPGEYKFSLTLVDEPQAQAFSFGGGYLSVTAPLLDCLLEDNVRGRDMLAFVLAREIGHMVLGHCRRGLELALFEEELQTGISDKIERESARRLLQTSLAAATALARFLYTPAQEFEADLFALQLCRNAGLNSDRVLDALRWECLKVRPDLKEPPAPRARAQRALATAQADGALNLDPFLRLKRLQMELSGEPDAPADYGLFAFDREEEKFHKAAEMSIGAGDRAVVFVHGMESGSGAHRAVMRQMIREQQAASIELLEFRYPNDQSLARSGEFLTSELRRVCAGCGNVDFVCHSAGGLVFRYYAEVKEGELRRAIFQGTPHGGSDLARLRLLLETAHFLRSLKFGYPEALEKTILDGDGQIARDLDPASLFLDRLRHRREIVAIDGKRVAVKRVDEQLHERIYPRYYVFRGWVLHPAQGALLAAAIDAARNVLRGRSDEAVRSPVLARTVRRSIDSLLIPAEISSGDLCVSLERAMLAGVPEENVFTVRANHLSIKSAPGTVQKLIQLLLETAIAP
ncbi:MAG TPA: M48 family metalloprotease [Planctomycetaceae bacterium]|nr:M48 family metalloprotease [Planctomycetaceae bacterium]